MITIEKIKEMYQILDENYQDISDEADVYLFKLVSDLDYHIEEVLIDKVEMRAYIIQEVKRVRRQINLPSSIDVLKFEDESFFREVYSATNKEVLEVDKEKLEKSLNRYFTVFYGWTEKDWELMKVDSAFKNEGYEEVRFIVKLWALKRYNRVLKTQLQKLDGVEKVVSHVHWEKKNITEFVQFVYGLIESGYINGYDGERTKIVEEMALVFNFPLPESWNVNLSASINNRNADYEPKIFDNIKKGYLQYSEKILNKKK